MSKKKIAVAGSAVALCVALAGGGTLAYFTADDTAANGFTVGNVKIDLTEPNWDTKGSEDAPEVYAGEPLAKDPTVANIGDNPCFVRIKVEGLDSLGEAGPITYRTAQEHDADNDNLNDAWEYKDGYYYYKHVLKKGETTPALFDQVVMPTGLTNDDKEGNEKTSYTINVTAQAVQAQGALPKFSDVEKMDVTAINGWFKTAYGDTTTHTDEVTAN